MRYKIGFDFPYLDQKNILHAHSHFAFSGWIAHSIYVLMLQFIANKQANFKFKTYKIPLLINLFCAYGMLISFFFTGYSSLSILLSSITIFNNAFFTYFLFRDFKLMQKSEASIPWFKAGLCFNLLSSLGTFYLAYTMSTRHFNQDLYLASVYFYLHFQYNGFFIFSCMGFALHTLKLFIPSFQNQKIIFILFFSACIPAYFLSTLWTKLPLWLYILTVLAAITQVLAWYLLVKQIHKAHKNGNQLSKFSKFMLLFVAIAFTIKLMLQLGSTIPEISKLAFGFRPVVIAYLHLVLLAIISVFLLSQFYILQLISPNKRNKTALMVILFGIFMNEVVLGLQGVASFSNLPILYINQVLLIIGLVIFIGLISLNFYQTKYPAINTNN
ncbi:MAG: hypothetical protein WCR21_06535 [Bacteroidota bacterium]